jgi:hypothetical protein
VTKLGSGVLIYGFVTSALKMERVCCSETLVSTCEFTRLQNPKHQNHTRLRKTLRYYTIMAKFPPCTSTTPRCIVDMEVNGGKGGNELPV